MSLCKFDLSRNLACSTVCSTTPMRTFIAVTSCFILVRDLRMLTSGVPSVIALPLSSISAFTDSSSSANCARCLERSVTPPLTCLYCSFVAASESVSPLSSPSGTLES